MKNVMETSKTAVAEERQELEELKEKLRRSKQDIESERKQLEEMKNVMETSKTAVEEERQELEELKEHLRREKSKTLRLKETAGGHEERHGNQQDCSGRRKTRAGGAEGKTQESKTRH
ncbi:hypothetical protein D4764_14G0002400 [Takifugu flavidus]|uniref:Uncharacterized protein n=1 Tax=Takifugu flavidus TaxID=433684 RepID=A0A5C6P5P8_9TELE|nr:hypothetical protein D4764_14G0002400 [Takifugu flavidus]